MDWSFQNGTIDSASVCVVCIWRLDPPIDCTSTNLKEVIVGMAKWPTRCSIRCCGHERIRKNKHLYATKSNHPFAPGVIPQVLKF